MGEGSIAYSLFLAVQGQRYVCIIKLNIDFVGNQLMKPFHSLCLDKLSVFTLWKQTVLMLSTHRIISGITFSASEWALNFTSGIETKKYVKLLRKQIGIYNDVLFI